MPIERILWCGRDRKAASVERQVVVEVGIFLIQDAHGVEERVFGLEGERRGHVTK